MKFKNNFHFFWTNLRLSTKKRWRKARKKTKKYTKKHKKGLIITGLVIVLVFTFFASIGFAAYFLPAPSQGIVKTMIRILPYPAAMVNGDIVRLDKWEQDYISVKQASEKQGSQVVDSQIREDVLNNLIYNKFLEQLADDYDIEITDEDIQNELDAIAAQLNEGEELDQEVEKIFGWDMETFIANMIEPMVLRSKLANELPQNQNLLAGAEKQAQDLLDRINAGEDFAELAKEYSDDIASGLNGGDLGLVKRGIMVKPFEDAAFSLEVGQVSNLVQTVYGYHILRVDEKVPADEEAGTPEQVAVRHILIAPKSFDQLLQEHIDQAKVWRFVRY
jgi:parvulin-like peptidyl-prolyl isomerase